MTARRWRATLIVAAVIITLSLPLPLLFDVDYTGSHDLHASIEVIGGLIGLVVGVTFLLRFTTLGDRVHLLFGLAFLSAGAIDIVHGLVPFLSERGFVTISQTVVEQVVPATFEAGRLTMVVLLVAAPLAAGHIGRVQRRRRTAFASSVGVFAASAAVATVAFFLPGPSTVFAERLIARPYDLVLGLAFVVATVVLLRLHVRTGDVMTWWVAVSAAIGIVVQVSISFAGTLHTAHFDLAHLYKVASYTVPLLGLSLYQVRVIQDRNRYAAALEVAGRVKSDFVSMISHELRTPIATIMGFTDLAYEDWDELDPDERREYLELIDRQMRRLGRLVDDLFAAARLQGGRILARPQIVELRSFVDGVLHDLGFDGADVQVKIDRGARAWADPDHVERILTSLVSNALSHGSPPVQIATGEDDDGVLISVTDRGDGVPAAFQQRLFEPFAQAEANTDGTRGGLGLGLAIAQGLATTQGGDLWFEALENGGSRFVLRLPAAD
jgi:signal transduction histidine kinase